MYHSMSMDLVFPQAQLLVVRPVGSTNKIDSSKYLALELPPQASWTYHHHHSSAAGSNLTVLRFYPHEAEHPCQSNFINGQIISHGTTHTNKKELTFVPRLRSRSSSSAIPSTWHELCPWRTFFVMAPCGTAPWAFTNVSMGMESCTGDWWTMGAS